MEKTQPFPAYEVAQMQTVVISFVPGRKRDQANTEAARESKREAEGLLTFPVVCLNVNQQVLFCCAANFPPI